MTRCCAKCKNPFTNCGHKECRCHLATVVVFPETPQPDLDHADHLNNTRNPHIE